VNEDSVPNLFALTDSGLHLWIAKLGDRINALAVANNDSLVAAAHIGASFGTLEDMILADVLTGPAEIAYLDTPDGAYVDINRSIKE
jgi:hypothetical protein